jgi:hypothetical protein
MAARSLRKLREETLAAVSSGEEEEGEEGQKLFNPFDLLSDEEVQKCLVSG